MYCSKCGTKNVDEAIFCSACGDRISRSVLAFKKTPVLTTIFLTIITIGVYYPVWFLTRRNVINNLESEVKVGWGIFAFAIIFISISLLFAVGSGMARALIEITQANELIQTAKQFDTISNIIDLTVSIILIFQCFKVRHIFNDHFNVHQQKGMSFSKLATFFFGIFYLQYKINRF